MKSTRSLKTTIVAAAIGAAGLTGAGFGVAHAMTATAPHAVVVTHNAPDKQGTADKPEAGDTPDAPSATDKPEAGDTPDAPSAADKPEAGDTPDAPSATDKPEAGDTPDTVQHG